MSASTISTSVSVLSGSAQITDGADVRAIAAGDEIVVTFSLLPGNWLARFLIWIGFLEVSVER